MLRRTVLHDGDRYEAVIFWCPGCQRLDTDGEPAGGLHMLPVSGDPSKRPTWSFDGNLTAPTLDPSILTRGAWGDEAFVCHSFLRGGRFEFLGDCTHPLAGQTVELPPLPRWVLDTPP